MNEDKTVEVDSTFLFPTPSFVEGFARAIDIGGALNRFNTSPSGEVADFRATRADWRAVGVDLANAMRKAEKNS